MSGLSQAAATALGQRGGSLGRRELRFCVHGCPTGGHTFSCVPFSSWRTGPQLTVARLSAFVVCSCSFQDPAQLRSHSAIVKASGVLSPCALHCCTLGTRRLSPQISRMLVGSKERNSRFPSFIQTPSFEDCRKPPS